MQKLQVLHLILILILFLDYKVIIVIKNKPKLTVIPNPIEDKHVLWSRFNQPDEHERKHWLNVRFVIWHEPLTPPIKTRSLGWVNDVEEAHQQWQNPGYHQSG